MLLREDSAGLISITQPAHAWVSGQLARAWGNEQFGDAPWEGVCLAAEQHDIGWLPWETAPTLNPQTGRPHSFMEVPTPIHLGIWSGAKQLALPFGRYVALLISGHGTGLYERFRSWENSPVNAQVRRFLEQEYAFQASIAAALRDDLHYAPYATPGAVSRNQQLVAAWDSLSLMLCGGRPGKYEVEVPTATGKTTLTLAVQDLTRIVVSPWPFQPPTVTLVYEGRRLPETFTDQEKMQTALERAPWVTLTTTLQPN